MINFSYVVFYKTFLFKMDFSRKDQLEYNVNFVILLYFYFNPLTRIKLKNPKTWIPHVI